MRGPLPDGRGPAERARTPALERWAPVGHDRLHAEHRWIEFEIVLRVRHGALEELQDRTGRILAEELEVCDGDRNGLAADHVNHESYLAGRHAEESEVSVDVHRITSFLPERQPQARPRPRRPSFRAPSASSRRGGRIYASVRTRRACGRPCFRRW